MVLGGCGPQAALDALSPAGGGRAAAAPAGDLLLLEDGTRVRLAGIEAPKGDEPYAAEARAALERLAAGRPVELLSGGARQDAYGRVLAQARRAPHGSWLQAALLDEGAARVRTYRDNRAMAAEMLEAEARARAAGRGLWSLPAYRVRLPEEVGADARGLVLVEGWVRALERRGDRVLVRLSPGLAGEIPRTAWDDLAAAGLGPDALRGRLVRVRGTVRPAAGGLLLRIDHPEQIERLEPRGPQRKRPALGPGVP